MEAKEANVAEKKERSPVTAMLLGMLAAAGLAPPARKEESELTRADVDQMLLAERKRERRRARRNGASS